MSLSKKVIKLLSLFIPNSQLRKKFRQKFNQINPGSLYRINRERYNIGEYTYMGPNSYIVNEKESKIGKYCSIADQVAIGTSMHRLDCLTTHGFICNEYSPAIDNLLHVDKENIVPFDDIMKPINIENDVWIGLRSIILDGVTIHDGAVVGAGAVVTHDVPPYAIVGGVPAKIIRYRFDESTIQKLLELKWWDYPASFVEKLPFQDIEKCIQLLEKNKHLRVEKK